MSRQNLEGGRLEGTKQTGTGKRGRKKRCGSGLRADYPAQRGGDRVQGDSIRARQREAETRKDKTVRE